MKPFGRLSLTSLLLHSALIQATVFLVRPTASYQALELGAPAAALGAIGAAFAVLPLLLAVPAGLLADRFGSRPMILIGSGVTLAATVAFLLWGTSLVGLVLATAVLGAGHLACIVGQQSAVANTSRGGRLDSMFGYYTFMASLGQAAGPLLIPAVGGDGLTPSTTALFAVGVGLASALVLFGALMRNVRSDRPLNRSTDGSTWSILRTPGVARAIGTSALIVAAVDLTVVYVPALGVEREMTAASAGALLTIRAVASMASRLFLGRAAARVGRTRLMATSIALAAASFGVLALPVPEWALYVTMVTLGLGLGVGQPLTMSWVTEQVPPARRGTALAVRLAGNRLSQVALPSAVGALGSIASAGIVLGATGALLAGTLLLIRGVRLDGDP